MLRLDRRRCIALFQGHKPALLWKLAPEELPGYAALKPCRVIDYIPKWQRREEKPGEGQPSPASRTSYAAPPPTPRISVSAETAGYDIPDLKTAGKGQEDIAHGEVSVGMVRGDDEDEEKLPPRY